MRPFLLALFLLAAADANAQAVPDTDIFLFDLHALRAGEPVDTVVNLTNRPGYDNQPAFTADGHLLYTSIRDGQTDIYRIDLETGMHHQATFTPSSEYSPTPLPDGSGFSVVKVEADGAQRLWRFDLDGMASTVVLEHVEPVGYHAWADARTVALFVLGEPPTLQIADVRTGRVRTAAHDIGRALHRVPGRQAISFVQKAAGGGWLIRLLDLVSNEVTTHAATLPEREDYTWTPDGDVLMGHGTALYVLPDGSDEWQLLADFSGAGLGEVTRLAVDPSGRWLALVAEPATH